jgi:hypothetical protein
VNDSLRKKTHDLQFITLEWHTTLDQDKILTKNVEEIGASKETVVPCRTVSNILNFQHVFLN